MVELSTTNIGFEKQIWEAACVLRGNIEVGRAVKKTRDGAVPSKLDTKRNIWWLVGEHAFLSSYAKQHDTTMSQNFVTCLLALFNRLRYNNGKHVTKFAFCGFER